MKRDEPARMLSMLAELCSSGEYVLHAARMVGDEEDHAIWRQSLRNWRGEVAGLIDAHFPHEGSALRQLSLDTAGSAGWKQQYEGELRTVRATLELLAALSEAVSMSEVAEQPEYAVC